MATARIAVPAAIAGALFQLTIAAAFLAVVVFVFWPLAAGLDFLKRTRK